MPVELGDLIGFLRAMKIERAIFIGTSRGGILTMALASIMPQVIAGSILNDVGPVLEMDGLLRIKGYVGKIPKPRSWSEAIASLRNIMGAHFPAFGEQDWENHARRTWDKTWDERFEPRSDPAISAAFDGIDPSAPPPALWPQFEALAAAAPLLVLRGEHSDLLSRGTVAEMQRRNPRHAKQSRFQVRVTRRYWRAPEVIQPILGFVARCDHARSSLRLSWPGMTDSG